MPEKPNGDSSHTEAFNPFQTSTQRPHDADALIGSLIAGRYRLVEVIGEGGMGSVYRAEQTEPVKRHVALKLIKHGGDSRAIQARFESERQALALMDHPNIARVYDGGTEGGHPFFVMELVSGVPLTEYCDRRRLPVTARLQLFVAICQAVQHAHQKGIIHRDLKPGNVLVTEVDGVPTPKVIDFGVAKATEVKLTDQSFGDVVAIVGTPTYMSPEQADPTSMDIDTRTDVYALGVMLYELLVGSPPLDAKDFKRGALIEMLRMVREEEPPRPSTKLSTADALPNIAANRSIDPAKLGRLLRGELDWVVMKALEKDRTRRYETANGLARDIQRYLGHEPVEARPPSARYRMRKFVRRNRVMVTAGAAVAAALLIGIVGFAWQAKIAQDQRDRAVLAESESKLQAEIAQDQRDRAVLAENQTKKRADELHKVADYQEKMLQRIDATDAGVKLIADLRTRHSAAINRMQIPEEEKAARTASFDREINTVNATDAAVAMLDRTVLAPAVKVIDSQFADQPLVDATLRTALGNVYYMLGRRREPLELYQRAYELRGKSLGEDHRDTLLVRGGVGKIQCDLLNHSEAEVAIRATFEGLKRVIGIDQKETMDAMSLLTTLLHSQGKYGECESVSRELVEGRRRVQGPEHADTLDAMSDLGRYLINQGKYAEAATLLREVADIQRRVDDAAVVSTLNNLGLALTRQRQHAAAEPYLRETLERQRRTRGEEHPLTIIAIGNLASLLMDNNKLAEAESLAREALEKARRVMGNEQSQTLKTLNIMGQILFRQQKYTETEPYYREAMTTGRRVIGNEHPDTIIWIANYGTVMQRLGRLDEAESHYREAAQKHARALGQTHPYSLISVRNVVDLLRQRGKLIDAEAVVRPTLDALMQKHGEKHADTQAYIGHLGSVLRDQGKFDEAEKYFQQTIDVSREMNGDDHATTITAILRMASLWVLQGKHAEAIALLTPLEGKVQKAFPGDFGVLRNASRTGLLGKAAAGLAKQPSDFAGAETKLIEAHGAFAKLRGDKDKETKEWVQGLVELYEAWHKVEPGKGRDAKAAEWKGKLGEKP